MRRLKKRSRIGQVMRVLVGVQTSRFVLADIPRRGAFDIIYQPPQPPPQQGG